MKIAKKIDYLNRLNIPRIFLKKLGINSDEFIEIEEREDCLILRPSKGNLYDRVEAIIMKYQSLSKNNKLANEIIAELRDLL